MSPGSFLDLIWSDTKGFVYLAAKAPGNESQFAQFFFKWPDEKPAVLELINEKKSNYEVYFAPSLFKERSAKKESVLGSHVFFCEFDGAIPTDVGTIPQPTVRVQSSAEENQHWYWRTPELIQPYDLERVNRSITYLLGADTSGWDANQILRPVGTFNHKKQREVKLVALNDVTVSLEDFAGLPEPPPAPEAPVPDAIPDISDVISQYKFSATVWALFRKGVPEGKRSEGLMSLGYSLAEMQLKNDEIFAVLLNADMRWGKYHGRSDQYKRLMEIVVRARAKYPLKQDVQEEDLRLYSVGFDTLLKTEVELKWVWEGLLQEAGYFLLTGPSGVGKTQFSLDAAAKFIVEEEFLGRPITGEHKIGFFSLEMGLVDLKYFLELQAENYNEADRKKLEENFRIFPLGEPIYLSQESERQKIEEVIEREQLTGIVFDSLGSLTEKSVSNEEDVKTLMDWQDRIRKRYNVFSWLIHHHRKASGDNKRPNKLSDVYGNQYITARATTVMCLWDLGVPGTIQVLPLKIRLSEKPNPFNIYRNGRLQFTHKKSGLTLTDSGSDEAEDETLDSEEDVEIDTSQSVAGIDELEETPGGLGL